MSQKKFFMGNEVLGRAARAAGALAMYGYPITPTTEILHFWSKEACGEQGKKDGLVFLQAEDETAAGFMLIGGVLAGVRSFTATAGPGHVLMQDAFSMAEAMRLPVVAYISQRGGPSTSTVIYSQSEVNLACFGGNGNGYRIVYSPSSLQDLYDYGLKVFDVAWKYRFPTFLLGDGYLAKMMGEVELYDPAERGVKIEPTEAYMPQVQSGVEGLGGKRTRALSEIMPAPEFEERTVGDRAYACYRNCLNLEEETLEVNLSIKKAFDAAAPELIEYEEYGDAGAETLVVSHGIVSAAAKAAIDGNGGPALNARLFRPITLRPFPEEALRRSAEGAKRIIVPESAIGQLSRFVRDVLYGHSSAPVIEYGRPSIGITPEELVEVITANQSRGVEGGAESRRAASSGRVVE